MQKLSWPNRLTLARILLVAPFVLMLFKLQDPDWGDWARYAALAIFALMAVSDALDGYLARKLNQETAVGRFLDPLADKLLILCSVLFLTHHGTHVPGFQIPHYVAVLVIGKDVIIVLGFCIVYLATTQVYINPRVTGKLCTLFQLLMVIGVLIAPDLPAALSVLPRLMWWGASALAVITVIHYFQVGRRFVAQYEQSRERDAPAPQ